MISGSQTFLANLTKEIILKILISQIYKTEAHRGFSVNDSSLFPLFSFIISRSEFSLFLPIKA